MHTICRLRETVDQIQKGFTASDMKGEMPISERRVRCQGHRCPNKNSSELNSVISTDLIEICSETGGHQLHVFEGVRNELK